MDCQIKGLLFFDVGHSFYTAHIDGNVKFDNSIFKNASVSILGGLGMIKIREKIAFY